MPTASNSQSFLRKSDRKLWSIANRLRATRDATVSKHAALCLIFLKYISDSFAVLQHETEVQVRDPEGDYFLGPAAYWGAKTSDYTDAPRVEN